MKAKRGKLVVVSGPSGSGKTSIIERLRSDPRVTVSVSVTTRPRRADEIDGRDYHFVDLAAFRGMHERGRFVETNDVFADGHLYGSTWDELRAALAEPGRVYVMEVDVTGADNLIAAARDAGDLLAPGERPLYIFIRPPSMEVLERRLRGRGTDDDAAIARRLGRARAEIAQAERAGATMVVNEDLDRAVAEIRRIVGLGDETTSTPAAAGVPRRARGDGRRGRT